MSLATFSLSSHNGRGSLFSYSAEAARLADSMDSLAGLMLAHGYNPAFPAIVRPNSAGLTLRPVIDCILGGLRLRMTKPESGEPQVRKVLNGSTVESIAARLAPLADTVCEWEVVEGRRRIVSWLLAVGCGMDAEAHPIAVVEYAGPAGSEGVAAFSLNLAQERARKVDASGKVDAALMVAADRPSITETELGRLLGLKRGDSQLAHRGMVAFRRYALDWSAFIGSDGKVRVPSKEDIGSVDKPAPGTLLACVDGAEARKWAVRFLAGEPTRAKMVDAPRIKRTLESLPEGSPVRDALRKMASTLEDGAAFDAFIASLS